MLCKWMDDSLVHVLWNDIMYYVNVLELSQTTAVTVLSQWLHLSNLHMLKINCVPHESTFTSAHWLWGCGCCMWVLRELGVEPRYGKSMVILTSSSKGFREMIGLIWEGIRIWTGQPLRTRGSWRGQMRPWELTEAPEWVRQAGFVSKSQHL